MDKRNLFPDKYIGYHTFGLGVDNTAKNSSVSIETAANGHEYVDLGLPSGTLWAKCNVGAETETDYGLYFAWGDTQGYTSDQVGTGEGQKAFTWNDYKYGAYDHTDTPNCGITKYNVTDRLTTLELSDDAARVNMGGMWRIPTDTEARELILGTDHEKVTDYKGTGINGIIFINRLDSSKVLFIPFVSRASNGTTSNSDYASLWTSSLDLYARNAENAGFFETSDKKIGVLCNTINRCVGITVRGVLKINL